MSFYRHGWSPRRSAAGGGLPVSRSRWHMQTASQACQWPRAWLEGANGPSQSDPVTCAKGLERSPKNGAASCAESTVMSCLQKPFTVGNSSDCNPYCQSLLALVYNYESSWIRSILTGALEYGMTMPRKCKPATLACQPRRVADKLHWRLRIFLQLDASTCSGPA